MTPLAVALVLVSLGAAAFGGIMGLCVAFAKAEGDSRSHPVLALLTRRSNPVVNVVGAFVAWIIVFYALPKLAFSLVGIDDMPVFGLSFAIQLCALVLAFVVGERTWKFVE